MKKLLFILLLTFMGTSQAIEVIKSYHSDITIEKDGTLKVKETIVVHAEGKNIRQGIYRDFPTHYKPNLVRTIVPFKVINVRRNGVVLPLEEEVIPRGKRIYMRDGTWLKRGEYTFELEFTTSRQIGFFKQDELYWNVVGGDWIFPILKSSATVHLPDSLTTDQIEYTAYAGYYGSGYKKAFKAEIKDAHTIEFFCTQQLKPHQAFSIAIGMPQGTIIQSTDYQKWLWFLHDNIDWVFCFIMMVLFFLYVVFAYFKVKAHDPKRPIIALFEPPKDFTPGMVSYFVKRDFTSDGFAADIVNMGVHGWLSISQVSELMGWRKTYELKEKVQQEDPAVYKTSFRSLFSKGSTIKLTKANYNQTHKSFESLRQAYKSILKDYFVDGFIFSSLFFVLFGVIGLSIFSITLQSMAPLFVFAAYGCIVSFLLYYLTSTYTEVGFIIRDHIEGFKLYLKTAESEKLNYTSTPPERTPELYENYLPYAMALGVEKQWTQSFTPVFERLEHAGKPYHPVWYYGHGNVHNFRTSHFSSNTFASGLGASLASSINASAPGSRSGFGGGSGGAGGGGGGGGGGGC